MNLPTVIVRFFANLREIVGKKTVELKAKDIRSLLDDLIGDYPDLEPEILDDEGKLKNTVKIILNGRNIEFLDGLATELKEEDMLAVFPLIAGG